ncbi:putative WRKY transcription factor 19 [Glycine soja]
MHCQKGVEEKFMSINTAPQIKFDVFVSLRGKDIRNGFLSHLTEAFKRNQVHAFVDDKLERGEEIWPSLVTAIERSFILLIIFSQDYASSRWCLEELVTILECRDKYERIVIPVFYKMEPTNVQHQLGSYTKNAFAEHERGYKSKVQRWRRALNKCAHLSGIESLKFQLKDKALKTFSEDNYVSMHVTLQEMAWELIWRESRIPGRFNRLWNFDDIDEALKNVKATEAIRSIQIDVQNIMKQKLSPHIFAKMSRSQFLEISGEYNDDLFDQLCILAEGLQFLAIELRFFYWDYYPLKSLPENFSAKKLVVLNLPDSKMEKLWDGVKNLVNLKQVDLSLSKELMELPDLSKATNLEVLKLNCCYRLTNVHPSIFSLPKLEKLEFCWCISLTILASESQLCSLSYLNLDYCFPLKKFSPISENMKEGRLVKTMVKALPSSINNPRQSLPELPVSLETLDARQCISLKTVLFPSTTAEQLKENRKQVLLLNCLNLDEHTLVAIGLKAQINVMKFANHIPSTPSQNHVENCSDYHLKYCTYQCVYLYPGCSVPEWLEYKTTNDHINIDPSSAPPSPILGYIFCFVFGGNQYPGMSVRCNICITISIGDGYNGGTASTIWCQPNKAISTSAYNSFGFIIKMSSSIIVLVYLNGRIFQSDDDIKFGGPKKAIQIKRGVTFDGLKKRIRDKTFVTEE